MYKKGLDGAHKLVVDKDDRMRMMAGAHDSLGHRGFYATKMLIAERFWWPEFERDVSWYIKTCHLCQERQKTLLKIPPIVTHTPSLFQTLHADTMSMTPKSNGCGHIAHGRCGMTSWMEGRPLREETGRSVGIWLFEDIICRWGCIIWIITDNGSVYRAAVAWLERKYGIKGIKISPYNSKANGVVERGHFIIREGIVKSCQGNINQWPSKVHHAFFADKCITRKSTGFSPYYLLYGVDPVLPFDLTEATFLVHGFHSGMKTEELLALRIRQLEKRPEDIAQAAAAIVQSRLRSKEQFEKVFRRRLTSHVFEEGDLVLVRNSQVEKELDKKHKPRYLGPFQIVRRTKGGSYVLKELDGTVSRRGVAHFRLLPYVPRAGVHLPQVEFEERSDDDEESDNDSDEDASSSNEE